MTPLFIFIISILSSSIASSKERNVKEINMLLKDEQAELKVLRKKIKRQELAISSAGKSESAALKKLQGKFPAWKSSSFIPDLQRNFRVWVLGKEAN